MKTSPKVKRSQLRFYKERETPAILRIDGFAIPDNVPAEYPYHATFILRFIIHGVVPPFPAVATKAELPWKSLCDTDTQRKSPRHGTGGLIFLPLERGGEPRLISPGRSTTPNKSRCKYRALFHALFMVLTTNNINYPVKLNEL